jgi:hypothetical protein
MDVLQVPQGAGTLGDDVVGPCQKTRVRVGAWMHIPRSSNAWTLVEWYAIQCTDILSTKHLLESMRMTEIEHLGANMLGAIRLPQVAISVSHMSRDQ